MNVLKLFEAIFAGVCFTVGEILEKYLVKNYSVFDGIRGNFEEIEFISSAEIIISKYVLFFIGRLHN